MCHQYMSLAMQCNALRLTLLLCLTVQRSWCFALQCFKMADSGGVTRKRCSAVFVGDMWLLSSKRVVCVGESHYCSAWWLCYKMRAVECYTICSVQVLQDGGSRVWPLGGSHTPTTGRSAWQCVDTLPPQASIGFLMTFLLLRLFCRDTGTLIGFLMAWHQ